MGAFDEAPVVQPADREGWRQWLEINHATADGVWLVSWRLARQLATVIRAGESRLLTPNEDRGAAPEPSGG